MRLSPLQLLEYTFEGVSVTPVDGYKADPEFSPSLVFFPGKLAMSADTGQVLLAEETSYSDFGIRLTLRVGPKEDKQAPYQVVVSVRGVVRMHLTQSEGQAQERQVRALVNGVSLLYGVVREMVSGITSRSTYGQFLLPSLNFSDLASRSTDDAVAAAAPVAPMPSSKSKPRKTGAVHVRRKAK